MTLFHSLLKRTPALIIMTALSVSFLLISGAPRQAKAQWPVSDVISYVKMAISHATQLIQTAAETSLEVKEYGLDPIAWAFEKTALQTVTGKMLNMVSSGYHDPYTGHTGPMFVTNLLENLRDNVGTPVANTIITNVGQGSSPFANAAALQIRRDYYNNSSSQNFWSTHNYTLSQLVGNPSQFLQGDFSQGGVNGFLNMVSNPMNNPYGTYFAAQNHLNTKVASARTARTKELTYGGGFLSSPGMPGSIVKTQLNKDMGSGVSSMVAADEISEAIGGLAANLVTNSLGGKGGLGGFTQPGTSGNSGVSNYAHQNPPAKSIKSIAQSLINQINVQEKTLSTYINNWNSILSPTKRANVSLTNLINYTPPKNTYTSAGYTYIPQKYALCLNNFKALQPVASASEASVQKIISRGIAAISNAQAATRQFEIIRTEINNAVKSGTLAAITQATNDYQNLTGVSSGLMPSGSDVGYASTQSVYVPSSQGGGGVRASGIDNLTVTGGTVVSQMSLLSGNAINALAKTKTCFANSISGG